MGGPSRQSPIGFWSIPEERLSSRPPEDRCPPQMPGTGCAGPHPSYPQLLLRQVAAAIDAPVHGHKALEGRPVTDIGVVEAGVEHDDGEGQDVAGVCGKGQQVRVLAPVILPLPRLLGAKDWLSQWPEGPSCPPCFAFEVWPHLPVLADFLLPTNFSCHVSLVPSHPCAFAPTGPPARGALPSLSTHGNPSLSAPAPARLPAEPFLPPCPLCSLPPRNSENTYCWQHCSGAITCCLVTLLASWGSWGWSSCSLIQTVTCLKARPLSIWEGGDCYSVVFLVPGSRAREVQLGPQLSS